MSEPKISILVVDDDRAICEVIRRTLQASFAGAAVQVAHDGVAAVDLLDPAIDLIILDLGLPKLRGEGVALANELKHANSPILIITGEPSPDLSYMGDVNVMGLLKKPFEMPDLVKAVRAILDGGEHNLPAGKLS
ncbi:response regulator transcription factor [bacterium]|nr:response regulator transcription factor [bacterium]